MQMPSLHAVEGSKQPQVSALPERRVKKQRQTAFTGYFRSSKGLRFFVPKTDESGQPRIYSIGPRNVLREVLPLSTLRAVTRVPLSLIDPSPDRPRGHESPESTARLADSIRLHGLLSPLLVREADGGRYRLVAGERRLAALRLLRRDWAEAIVVTGSDCDCALIALVENLQRENLHYLDVATACRRMLDRYPLTQERLAASLSVSPSALANRLRLLKLSPAVQDNLRALGLSERHARALLRLEDEQDQLSLAAQAAEKRLSVKQLEAMVNLRLAPKKQRRRPSPAVRDNRIVINALLDTVRQLTRCGIPVASRIEEGEDCVNVIVTIPSIKKRSTPTA